MTAPRDAWLDGLSIEANGCWRHANRIQKRGYLQMWWHGKMRYAHRMMYEWLVGPIPAGLTLDHLCRNRWCLNPSHLEPVTLVENNMRGESPHAQNARKTHCPKGHLLDGVVRHTTGRGPSRRCLTCHRERENARYHARKNDG